MSFQFELMKLKKALNFSGTQYTFKRRVMNEYKGYDDTLSESIVVKGLFHETSGYVKVTSGESAQITSKPQPMILASYSEAKLLKKDDIITIGDINYLVTNVKDLQNQGVIADVSLEVAP